MLEEEPTPPSRLDRIATQWSLVQRAHGKLDTTARQARNDLVMRYSTAIRGYMRAIVRDDDVADELAQDAVVRMLKGDFGGADPDRGRFRDFLKAVVRNMARDHWAREKRRRPVDVEPATVADATLADEAWFGVWRESILEITWSALRRIQQQQPDQHDCTLLTLRIEHPNATSEQLAEKLGARLGRDVRADAVRQRLRRARKRFAVQLLSEIASGLPDPSVDAIEQELVDVGLYERIRGLLPDDWKATYLASNGPDGEA